MRKLLFAMSLLIAGNSMAQELPKNYAQLLEKVEPELIQWRRHFHQNPELSNREYNTGKYIADFLKTLPGVEVRYLTPENTTKLLERDTASWAKAIKAGNIKSD